MRDEILAILVGGGFGVSLKIADMVVDDGLHLFKYDGFIFGILWGMFGGIIFFFGKDTGAVYAALLAYWLIRGKLDHTVHHIGGMLLFLGTFLHNLNSHFFVIIALLTFYECSYHIRRRLQASGHANKFISAFFRYRLQFFLAPLGLSLVMSNPKPFLVVAANMFGLVLAYRLFRNQVILSKS